MSIAEPETRGDRWVGRSLKRKEDPRLITGRAGYVDDIVLPATLFAAFVRSPEARAKITSIDASAARERPGVHAVFTGEDVDLAAPLPMAWVPPGVDVNTPVHWPLAKEEVKHVGDPVAVVFGDDRMAVVDAAEDVLVEYEPLDADRIAAAAGQAAEGTSPPADLNATADYKRHLARVLCRRALQEAVA